MSYDCSCDYDPPSVYRATICKARKGYRCEDCPNKIEAGERYEYVFGVYEGYPFTARTCMDCVELRRLVQGNLPCFCWAHGSLREDIRSAIEDAYWRARDEVRGFAFSVGRLIIRQRRARAT